MSSARLTAQTPLIFQQIKNPIQWQNALAWGRPTKFKKSRNLVNDCQNLLTEIIWLGYSTESPQSTAFWEQNHRQNPPFFAYFFWRAPGKPFLHPFGVGIPNWAEIIAAICWGSTRSSEERFGIPAPKIINGTWVS